MDKQKKEKKIFNLHFGGIFAKPMTEKAKQVNPVKARNALIKILMSNKNVVEKVWAIGAKQVGIEKSDLLDTVFGVNLGDEEGIESYHWEYPLIFKMKVNKGFSFVDSDERRVRIESSIEAMVMYNGLWFMSLFDPGQFSEIDELFFCGPNIRELLVNLMKKGRLFVPQIIPPCIMPVSISIEVGATEREGKSKFPRYINSYKEKDISNLILKYERKSGEISDSDIVKMMLDMYFNVRSPLNSFYMLAALSHWQEEKRRSVIEVYEETCKKLKEYLEIPAWNIFKRSVVANRLGRNVSNIQVQLVENRLWQVRIVRQSSDIDSYEDRRGIIEHSREYLKNCITKSFEQSSEEYEGFLITLSHIEKISSQHNILMLGVVAIVAGIIGAVIGAMIN